MTRTRKFASSRVESVQAKPQLSAGPPSMYVASLVVNVAVDLVAVHDAPPTTFTYRPGLRATSDCCQPIMERRGVEHGILLLYLRLCGGESDAFRSVINTTELDCDLNYSLELPSLP